MSKVKKIIEEENEKIIENHPELGITIEELDNLAQTVIEANDDDDELIKDFRKTYKQELNDYLFGNKNETSFSNDALKDYLNQIGKYPLLNIDEEIELAKRIEQGDEKAKQKLIESNLRLVVYVAKKFPRYMENPLDLIQAGNIGLIGMIDKYDYRKGKFSTYAIWWIRKEISSQLSSIENNIQINKETYLEIRKIKLAEAELKKLNDRYPTDKELANHLGYTIYKVKELRALTANTVSLNSSVGQDDDDDLELQDIIPCENMDIDASIILENTKEELYDIINNARLTEIQKSIIYYRFGLDGKKRISINELASMHGKSPVWIRMQEKKALYVLRVVGNNSLRRNLI